MTPYRIHPEADAEFATSVRYYQVQSAEAAGRFVEAVGRAISLIQEYPEIGSPIIALLRRVRLQRFPFAIIYEFDGRSIHILAVADLRRRPNYWIDRL